MKNQKHLHVKTTEKETQMITGNYILKINKKLRIAVLNLQKAHKDQLKSRKFGKVYEKPIHKRKN